MNIFVDTSALYAIIDKDDRFHKQAQNRITKLIGENNDLLTSNYILVETIALLQNRLRFQAAKDFIDQIVPLLSVIWIDRRIHQNGINRLISKGRKKLSFVDCTSFEIMAVYGISKVFTYDKHFKQEGFEVLQ